MCLQSGYTRLSFSKYDIKFSAGGLIVSVAHIVTSQFGDSLFTRVKLIYWTVYTVCLVLTFFHFLLDEANVRLITVYSVNSLNLHSFKRKRKIALFSS